jgi:hypothetical protein
MKLHALCLAFVLTASCSNGLCPTVIQSAVQAQTKVSDGFRALDQVRAVAQGVPMPETERDQLERYTLQALTVLQDVNKVLAASVTACNEPNLDSKFAAFNTSWLAIKNLLSLFAQNAGYVQYVGSGHDVGTPARGNIDIADPFFFEMP